MFHQWRLAPACSLMACILIFTTEIFTFGQTPSSLRYAIPQFNGTPGSELVLSNLSTETAQADVRFFSNSGNQLSSIVVEVRAGNQRRLNSTFFMPTEGTAVVQSSRPLSVMATIVHANGAVENVASAPDAVNSVIPFYLGSASNTELTFANGNALPTTALIRAYASTGTPLAEVQRPIPPSGSFTEAVNSMFPQFVNGPQIAYFGVLAQANVLTEERRLHIQARVRDYADPALLPATTESSATLNPVLPFFVHGGNFVTTIQVVNTANSPASVSMVAYDDKGAILSIGSAVQLAAKGSIRNTAQNLLNLGPGVVSGSIVFTSDTPILVTEGIANTAQGAFAMQPAVAASETDVAFSQRATTRSYIGLSIANQNLTNARVRLRSIRDDGTSAAQVSVVVGPRASLTRSFDELLSDDQIDGFIHVSSDVPIFASALENTTDGRLMANLPTMRSFAGYNPPNAIQFRVKGTVRRLTLPVAGVRVQLSGALNLPLVTNTAGAYLQRVTPGQYSVEPSDSAYGFLPSSRTITITQDDSVGNDFEAFLLGPSPRPTLLSVTPASTEVRLGESAAPLLLTATGSDFVPGAKIFFDNVELPTQYVSPTSLTTSIPPSFIEVGRTVQVSVQNPEPSLGPSGVVPLQVNNPGPVLISIEPTSIPLDPTIPASISLLGLNFVSSSIFELTPPCAAVFATNRINSESGILNLNLQCAGTYYVRVRTPQPGGGNSQTLSFTVK